MSTNSNISAAFHLKRPVFQYKPISPAASLQFSKNKIYLCNLSAGLSFSATGGERKVRTAKSNTPVNGRSQSWAQAKDRGRKCHRKLPSRFIEVRVKTWGKSSRVFAAMHELGKPCVL